MGNSLGCPNVPVIARESGESSQISSAAGLLKTRLLPPAARITIRVLVSTVPKSIIARYDRLPFSERSGVAWARGSENLSCTGHRIYQVLDEAPKPIQINFHARRLITPVVSHRVVLPVIGERKLSTLIGSPEINQ